jgi:hypothetical protein
MELAVADEREIVLNPIIYSVKTDLRSLSPSVEVATFIENIGQHESIESELRLLLSRQDQLDDEAVEFDSVSVRKLPVGGTVGNTWNGEINFESGGDFWIIACVTISPEDSSESEFCSEPYRLDVPDIDLAVDYADVRPLLFPSTAIIEVSSSFSNNGSDPIEEAQLIYVVSRNSQITHGDPSILKFDVDALASGEVFDHREKVRVQLTKGQYWIGACLLPLDSDSDKTDNCSQGREVDVLGDALPDLTVVDIKAGPESWAENKSSDLYAKVRNIGSKNSDSTSLKFFLGLSDFQSDDDVVLGTVFVEALKPGRYAEANFFIEGAIPPGNFWIYACVAELKIELDTFNNCSDTLLVDIFPH